MPDLMPQPKRNSHNMHSTLKAARTVGYVWGIVGSTALILLILLLIYWR